MAADVVKFSAAIDKVYKTFSTQEIQFKENEMKGMTSRASMQYMEQKFQQQLQRARAAFLTEFRNHSVVVETEVKRIREELTLKLEEKYGDRIRELKEANDAAVGTEQKLRDEISRQKALIRSHEQDIRELRRRDAALGQKEKLQTEILQLNQLLESTRQENTELMQKNKSQEEVIATLTKDVAALDAELKSQVTSWSEERERFERQQKDLQMQMQQNQETFRETLATYQQKYEEYKAKTLAELQIADILNARRAEALANMEEERQRHIRARTKPSKRIGLGGEDEDEEDGEEQPRAAPYEMAKDSNYRRDEMGMDTAWRDYQLGDLELVPPNRKPRPHKFQVEQRTPRVLPPSMDAVRARQRASAQNRVPSLGANPPTATDTPRQAVTARTLAMGHTTVLAPPPA